MKKLLLLFSAALTMLLTGCMQFDDTRIWDAIDKLEDLYDDIDSRLEDLEEECEKMNTNIEALQTLVTALQNSDTITSIVPIKQGDKVVGYTISFSKSEPITIYHGNDGKDGADGEDGKDGENGADGKDGYTPTIGVAKDTDGNYYWTLDGEWLLDENGNKIKANGTDGKDGADGSNGNDGANGENGADGEDGEDGEDGADGKDGITPQLEIRDGYWYISYDNGATWIELGKATGEDGKDGEDGTNGADGQDGKDGDSLFESVTWDDEYAYFTLSDGTVIKIPLASDSEAEEGDLPPANEIWYTSTDGDVVTPYYANVFGASIVSNTYNNGKGVITFDGDVTTIGEYAFTNCWSLASVTIPEGVTSIGQLAFYYSESLASVTIPDSVTSIGERAFSYCRSLVSVTIPEGVTSIGESAFFQCKSLASISIPEGVTSIEDYTFWGCESLASISIPEGVTSIGNDAFMNCSNLAEFEGKFASEDGRCLIVDGVLNAFAPYGLTEYTIPDGVTSIGYGAFANCSSLATITIPEGVTSIGYIAFYSCSSLAEVYCKATTPPTTIVDDYGYWYAFHYNASGRKIYVPAECVEAYKSALGWSDYADAIEGYDFE